jgi:hypothetical protein
MKTKTNTGLAAMLLAVALGATPQGEAAVTHVPIPPAKTENGIKFLSGGIGSDEAFAMRLEAERYPLSLVFIGGVRGEYLADVDVTIADSSGRTVLKTVAGGPYLLLDLPEGNYTITAQYGDKSIRRPARVTGGTARRISFRWLGV